MKDLTLRQFIIRCQKVTERYEKLSGRWTLNEQVAHVHSEVSELYQARKHNEGEIRELEEAADVVLSSITLFTIMGANEEAIIPSLLDKLSVVEQRVGKAESIADQKRATK